MTLLRQRMIEEMQLRGLAESTQKSYMYTVRRLATMTAHRIKSQMMKFGHTTCSSAMRSSWHRAAYKSQFLHCVFSTRKH